MTTPSSATVGQVPVSVVIPCFACVDTIDRAVESVLSQTLAPLEIWLIEDGTPDEGRTVDKLLEIQRNNTSKIRLELIVLDSNRGPSVARNVGWDSATQPYIAFLDADDAWHPRKLEIQHRWMLEHPEVALTGHQWPWDHDGKNFPPTPRHWRSWRVSPFRELLSNRFSTSTVMLKRDLSYRFAEDDWFAHDFDLWMRVVLDGFPAWRLELPLAHTFKRPFGERGISKDVWPSSKAEFNMYLQRLAEGRINPVMFALLLPWLAAKVSRRLVLTQARRIRGQLGS